MKHIALKSLILGVALIPTLTACDENSWNDEYLDGFEKPSINKTETVIYDMTAADIKKLAGLSKNINLAAERGESALLKEVAENGFFTAKITPEYYAPAWLDSLSAVKGSMVYYLSEKSTLKLNFPTSDALPAELTGIQTAPTMEVSEEQYQDVWGSETDFVEAFSPSKPAGKFLPELIAADYVGSEDPFVVVSYNVASQDPVFGGGSSTPDVPDVPAFEMSNTIGSLTIDQPITASGIVTGICKQGYILTDLSGSTLVYYDSSFAIDDYAIGQQRTVSGKGGAFGGCLQIGSPTEDELIGSIDYTYPAPLEITGEIFEQFSTDRQALKAASKGEAPVFSEIKGAIFTQSGNYVNFSVPGADPAKATGSGYQVPADVISKLDLGNPVDIRGYVIGCSGSSFVTFLVTEINGVKAKTAPVKSPALSSRAGYAIASETESAVYKFNGSKYALCSDVFVINANDYAQMGVKSNLTAKQAEIFLPIYLATKFPYAQEDATYYLVYNLANGDNTIKNFCSRATFTGTEWSITTVNTALMQFVRKGTGNGWSNWVYDPSIYIDLPAGKGASSAPFWQQCVDWVYEHIDVPEFGSTSIDSGVGYVTSYGNNDYFCGASAYQCNVDLRASAARKQVPSVYDSMDDEQVVATVKNNFETIVMPAVLAMNYPDAQPGNGVDQYYVISFVMYNGSSHDEQIKYLVTAPGTFEFVECTWNEEE